MTVQTNGKPQTPVAIGNIVEDFDSIVGQLRSMLDSLQDRVVTLTSDLQIATDISTQVATILDPDELLPIVADTVKERFGLYHAHIYLLDDKRENLVLTAGAGKAGRQMVQDGHVIPLDAPKSLVATTARTGNAVIVNDVFQNPDHLANPLLPDTRAEMSVPMIVGNEVIGVLDVQHDVVDRFTEVDRQVKTTLAGQLAVAIRNAQAFAQNEAIQRELELRSRDIQLSKDIADIIALEHDVQSLMRAAIARINEALGSDNAAYTVFDPAANEWQGVAGYGMDQDFIDSIHEPYDNLPHAVDALENAHVVVVDNAYEYERFPMEYVESIGIKSVVVVPIITSENVGVIFFNFNDNFHTFTEAEVALLSSLSTQLQTGLEVIQAQVERQRVLNISVDMIGSAGFDGYFKDLNPAWERILGFTRDELMAKPFIEFVHPDDVEATNAEAAKIADGATAISFTNRYITKSGDWCWIAWNATPDPRTQRIYFVARDITEQRAIQEEVEVRSAEIEKVVHIGSQINTELDVEALLYSISDAVVEYFDRYYAHIYLLSEAGDTLVLAGGAGDIGRRLVERGHQIPLDAERSLVARAARSHKPVLIQNVNNEPGWLPNPMLPQTQSELTVPILLGDELIGVLDVQDSYINAFSELQIETKLILANQIAIAIRNAQAFTAEQAIRRENELVAAIGEQLSAAQTDQDVLAALDLIASMMGASQITMSQPIDDYAFVDIKAVRDGSGNELPLSTMPILRYSAEQFPLVNIIKENAQNITYIADVNTDERVTRDPVMLNILKQINSEALIVIPFLAGDTVIGLVSLAAPEPTDFDDSFKQMIRRIRPTLSSVYASIRSLEAEQEARRENELVAAIGERLSAAKTDQDVLAALDPLTDLIGAIQVTMSQPIDDYSFVDIKAIRDGSGNELPLDTLPMIRYSVEQFPLVKVVRDDVQNIIYINDINTDERVTSDPEMLAIMQQLNNQALVIIPFLSGDTATGLVSFAVSEPTEFDESIKQIIRRLRPTMSSVYASIRSFESEQEARHESATRAAELESVAQVSTAASNILNVDELLTTISELTKTAFDLYHAHIYLYDETTRNLVLAGGAGEAGRVMVENGHRIPANHPTSIVAKAANTREGTIVNDVFESPTFMPNPMLPDTRSEMAVPMMVGDEVVGVLDVQSDEVGNFTNSDLQIKTILAAQVAVAVQNARAFERSQEIAERERATAERLREVDQLKSQFLASMSHELRTPLNSIIGYSEVLIDGGDGDLPEEAVEDIDIIYTSGRHLLAIINDILDLAKIEANQMHLNREDIDLVQILRDVIKTNQILVGDRPIELILDSEVDQLIVPADEIRIRQIVLNLFSNAVKFTDEGSVTIALNMQDDETARIAVIDTGMGISEEGQQIVFDQFRQVDGTSTRKKGGTGLGLTITRYLVQMHGGDIQVESKEGEGSTFWFTLPLIAPEEDPDVTLPSVDIEGIRG